MILSISKIIFEKGAPFKTPQNQPDRGSCAVGGASSVGGATGGVSDALVEPSANPLAVSGAETNKAIVSKFTTRSLVTKQILQTFKLNKKFLQAYPCASKASSPQLYTLSLR
jgi:hypothetical protein